MPATACPNSGYSFQPGGSGNGGSGPSFGLFAPDFTGGTFSQRGTGGAYGIHAGYNHQWDNLVGGIELNVGDDQHQCPDRQRLRRLDRSGLRPT